jgi:hypothetical protein
MLTKNERCKYATIYSKVQAIFVHIIINVILKYYGCYETTKNGNLHMHTLLWFNDSPNPNTLVQTLFDDEIFLNFLN